MFYGKWPPWPNNSRSIRAGSLKTVKSHKRKHLAKYYDVMIPNDNNTSYLGKKLCYGKWPPWPNNSMSVRSGSVKTVKSHRGNTKPVPWHCDAKWQCVLFRQIFCYGKWPPWPNNCRSIRAESLESVKSHKRKHLAKYHDMMMPGDNNTSYLGKKLCYWKWPPWPNICRSIKSGSMKTVKSHKRKLQAKYHDIVMQNDNNTSYLGKNLVLWEVTSLT